MEKIFSYEKDLVDTFVNNYFKIKNIVTIKELPIRWGNIDVVCLYGNKTVPFNKQQIEALSKPSNAKIFIKIKKNRPISKQNLFCDLGISEKTFEMCIRQLTSLNLINKDINNNYIRNINFTYPKVKIYGYEAKLTDYNKAFYQACLNKNYVDYSYLVFPMNVASILINKHINVLIDNNIGLIGVDNKKSKILLKAKQNSNIESYVKFMALIKYYEAI